MKNSSLSLTSRVVVLVMVLGAASGVIGAAVTTASLSKYAVALSNLTSPFRLPSSHPVGSAPSFADARDLVFHASAQLYAAKNTTPDPWKADRQGVVLTSDGWIAVADAGKGMTTVVVGRRSYPVERSVADAYSGIVFLKVDARNLPTVGFGDAFALAAGDEILVADARETLRRARVLSVMRPAALSADRLGRRIALDTQTVPAPAFSTSGDVLGFVTADGSLVPINGVLPAFRSLLKEGKILRPTMGLGLVDLARIVMPASATSIPENGLRIASLVKGSAAMVAGLRIGDVLQTIDGRPLDATHTLDETLLEYTVGQNPVFGLMRGLNRLEISVPLR